MECGSLGCQCHPMNLEEELRRYSKEIEPVSINRKEQPPVVGYRPTSRGTLAKHGFLVRQTLGSGSYSKVKMALNIKNIGGEKVAVKIVDRLKAPQDFQQKFLPRELKYWPTMRHPNLVRLFHCFEEGRRVFLILEHVENGNALRYIQLHHNVRESVARRWTYQITDAVRYMHDRDIAHRDLKLENLLLDKDYNIKICDFGFVKADTAKDLSRTYCGSKSYAAPEILQGRPYEPKKADIWAIGVIMFIFVTGRMPFDETKGTKHILKEQQELKFPWPKTLSEECKGLVLMIFEFPFSTRPTIQHVSNHKWFVNKAKDTEQAGPEPVSSGSSLDRSNNTNHPVQAVTRTKRPERLLDVITQSHSS